MIQLAHILNHARARGACGHGGNLLVIGIPWEVVEVQKELVREVVGASSDGEKTEVFDLDFHEIHTSDMETGPRTLCVWVRYNKEPAF